jgi:CBS domain-containing protein
MLRARSHVPLGADVYDAGMEGCEHGGVVVAIAEEKLVREIMVSRPKTLPAGATVAAVRRLFENESVRTALLVDGSRFAGALERGDVPAAAAADEPATRFVHEEPATVGPEQPAREAVAAMTSLGTRRLVVLGEDGVTLCGLVCLTADLEAFCSGGSAQGAAP